MSETIICQGREVSESDLRMLRHIIRHHPDWSQHKITQHICRHWGWCTHTGQLKTFAALSLIDKLEARGLITLPPILVECRRPHRRSYPEVTPPSAIPIAASVAAIAPISFTLVRNGSYDHGCFGHYLSRHHYLGFKRTVGEHLEYLVRDLACVLFGSAAWKSALRDRWIGWSDAERQCKLNFMTNNTRFLILPWVRVPHLTSHILGRILRRLQDDWVHRYGHPVYLGGSPRFKNWPCWPDVYFWGRLKRGGITDDFHVYVVDPE